MDLPKLNRDQIDALPIDKRERVVGAIRELDEKRELDPLSLYFPHQKQHIFHQFVGLLRKPVICFFGGNQSGKTVCGLADDLIQAIDADDLPSHLRKYKRFEPPFLCRIMAPSFPVLETTLYDKLQAMIPPHVLQGDSWGKAFDKNLRVLYFKNGSKFYFQTYEMDVSKMGGATLDRVHYDEEPPERARNECRLRVMARGGDEIFTMTPVEGLTWSYDELWDERGEEIHEGVFVHDDQATVIVDMDDNPALGEEQKRLALKGLSKEELRARKSGHFVALHGLIYDSFRRDQHIVPEITELPQFCNVFVGIDPGIRNRTGVVWIYTTPDDKMVVFHEGYYESSTAAEVAKRIHEVNAHYGRKPVYYVIDPAARNKEHQTGRSNQMEYADHGVIAIAGQNDVPAGINRVKERLESRGLFIADNCTHLLDELVRYRWKQPPRTGEDGPQKPVKKDDHLLDALRYAVMSRPYLPDVPTNNPETELERLMREDREDPPRNIAQDEFGAVAV